MINFNVKYYAYDITIEMKARKGEITIWLNQKTYKTKFDLYI